MTWVVQIGKGPRVRLYEPYGSEEFNDEYTAALASLPKRGVPKKSTVASGTLEWGWALYRKSKAWGDLSQATHDQRENIMENVLKNGNPPLSKVDNAAINAGIDRRKDTPAAARNFLDTMRGMFKWLVSAQIVKHDQTAGITVKREKSKGFPEWTYEEILKYEKRWPLGTRERVMLDVYLYTGLRRGDAARVGEGHVHTVMRDGLPVETISLATEKGQGEIMVHLPVLDVLRRTLQAGPIGLNSWICRIDLLPYTKESLGNTFKDACVAAGVLGKSAHGLRKAAATRAADNGATVHELMAIFGWITVRQAEVYTREADRKRLAGRAMSKLGA